MPEQLPLPLEGVAPRPSVAGLPRNRRVYVNRNLSMAQIDWVGFDMDYTLAIYDQEEMDRLSIDVTAARLLKRGYPEWITTIPYDTRFAIRGLLIDKKFGNVVKMDRYKAAGKAYRGFRQLGKDEMRSVYHQAKLRAPTSRYHFIDTLYALSEAAVYAGAIDAFDQRGLTVDHAKLFADIRECIDEAHRDGTVYAAVAADLPRYIRRDLELAPTLHKLRSAGKKLFLLTNSRRPYTDMVMSHLLGAASPEYPTWRHYFDLVVVAAGKPAFFQEHRPIMERVRDEDDDSPMRPAQTLERGRIYEGGNLHDLERMLGVTGDRVLYVGDHIYGDILRSKKESAWRTAMIIQELDTEVAAHETCAAALSQAEELEERRARLEDELRYHQTRFKEVQRQIEIGSGNGRKGLHASNGNGALGGSGANGANGANGSSLGNPAAVAQNGRNLAELEAERQRTKRAVERVRTLLREVEAESREIEGSIDRQFHPYWGSLLKEGVETSGFGDQVEEYACLYTSRVSNFFNYSPLQNFRSPRDLMPHEL